MNEKRRRTVEERCEKAFRDGYHEGKKYQHATNSLADKEQQFVTICRFVLFADLITFASAYCFGAGFRISLGLALAGTLVWAGIGAAALEMENK